MSSFIESFSPVFLSKEILTESYILISMHRDTIQMSRNARSASPAHGIFYRRRIVNGSYCIANSPYFLQIVIRTYLLSINLSYSNRNCHVRLVCTTIVDYFCRHYCCSAKEHFIRSRVQLASLVILSKQAFFNVIISIDSFLGRHFFELMTFFTYCFCLILHTFHLTFKRICEHFKLKFECWKMKTSKESLAKGILTNNYICA